MVAYVMGMGALIISLLIFLLICATKFEYQRFWSSNHIYIDTWPTHRGPWPLMPNHVAS